MPDHVLGVVGAALDLGPSQQPPDHLVGVHGEFQDHVEAVPGPGEHPVQSFHLGDIAGITVEQEPLGGIRLPEPVGDHVVGHLVRYELADVGIATGQQAQLGVPGDVGAEDVSGGDRGHLQPLGQPLRLRTLAGAGRAEQNQPHLKNPS